MPSLTAAPAVLILAAAPAAAQTHDRSFSPEQIRAARENPAFFTIDEKSVRLTALGPSAFPRVIAPPEEKPAEDPTLILDRVVNIASKLWSVIEKNRPVVDVKTPYASAVPEGTKNWSQLESWQPPQGSVYGLTAKNLYGVTVVDIRYQVLRTWGGRHKGKGRYLTAVTAEPLKVEVAWGYQLALAAEAPDAGLVNVGTSDDPVAGMSLTLKWHIKTPVKDSSGKGVYFLQGDGVFKEVGGPFSRPLSDKVAALLERWIPALQ